MPTDTPEQHAEYDEAFVAYLEALWGKGFLSPGGPEEVARILEGSTVAGLAVLDIGCGIGGADLALLRDHGASSVMGIDVEPQLIARCRALALHNGLSDRLSFKLVKPGPLPFADRSFDVVFSKDAMIHIPDKETLYRDVLRVLRPGGLFLASDWLRGFEGTDSETMKAWKATAALSFEMATPEVTQSAMTSAGFAEVEVRDRNRWFIEQSRRDLERLEGPAYRTVAAVQGEAGARTLIHRTRLRIEIVESGELTPCHLKGVKSV